MPIDYLTEEDFVVEDTTSPTPGMSEHDFLLEGDPDFDERILSAPVGAAYGTARGLLSIPAGIANAAQAIYRLPEAIGTKLFNQAGIEYDKEKAKEFARHAEQQHPGVALARETAALTQQATETLRPSSAVKRGEGGAQWWAESVPEVAGQLAGMVGTGLVLGPAPTLGMLATSAGGQIYNDTRDRLLKKGYNPEDAELIATGEGTAGGVVEAVLERLPFHELIMGNKRSSLLKFVSKKLANSVPGRFIGATAAEAIEESGSEASQMIVQWVAENDPEAFKNAASRVGIAAVMGAGGGLMVGTPMISVERIARGQEKATTEAKRGITTTTRTARHTFDADQLVNQLVANGETQGLQNLANKSEPTRKDFADAGLKDIRFNTDERAEYVQHLKSILLSQQPSAPAAIEPSPIPAAPPTPETIEPTPITEPPIRERNEEYITQQRADAERLIDVLGRFQSPAEQQKPEAKAALKALAQLGTEILTEDQIKRIQGITGGQPGPGALEQREPLHVQMAAEIQKVTGGKTVGKESEMFGEGGLMEKAAQETKRKARFTTSPVLTTESQTKLNATIKKSGEYGDPFGIAEEFEQHINPKGSRKIIDRAIDAVKSFISKAGGERFKQYYEEQNHKEDELLQKRFPELADPYMAMLFRSVNAAASAQTNLTKNTQEGISAWEGIRSTGQLPIAFETKAEGGKPIFQLPKPAESKFEGPTEQDVDSIVATLKDLIPTVPQGIWNILEKKTPIPEGLVMLSGKQKGQPVKTYNNYLYEWFAPTYVTGVNKKAAHTSSDGLVAKMAFELHKTDETAFRTRVRSAMEIGGGTSMENKAENYRMLNQILMMFQRNVEGRQEVDSQAMVKWLNERVPLESLDKLKQGFGYAPISKLYKNDIRDTVYVAEGQDKLIPRTFLFGPKVGAYMLNRMVEADPRNSSYNTMDVWESRFWRYMNDSKLSNNEGIADGTERKVFMRQARDFAIRWQQRFNEPMNTSAGQAARWYLEKQTAAEAGYSRAGEIETIPELTEMALGNWMDTQLGARAGGDFGQEAAVATTWKDENRKLLQEFGVELREGEKAVANAAIEKKEVKEEKEAEVAKRQAKKERVAKAKAAQGTLFEKREPAVIQKLAEEKAGIKPGEAPGVKPEYVNEDGTVNIYRYSHGDRGPTYVIDPSKARPQGYSRRDYDQSRVPRTFFYLNTADREANIVGNNLYAAQVDASQIYNLDQDPAGLKEKHMWGLTPDYHEIMLAIKKMGFKGISYRAGSMDLINMFDMIEGTQTKNEAAYKQAMEEKRIEPAKAKAFEAAEVAPPGTVTEVTTTDPDIAYTLFQKVGGVVRGTMEAIKENGAVKIILRAFKGSDTDTAVEELAHAIRRLTVTRELNANQRGFSDELLASVEQRFGVKDGTWAPESEEAFAKEFRKRISQGVKNLQVRTTKFQRALDRLESYMSNLYQNVKGGLLGDIEVSKEMDDLFQELVTRRERLTRGAPKRVVNSVTNNAKKFGTELTDAAIKNGGFTFDLRTGKHQKTGYSVAPSKASEYKIHLASTNQADIPAMIQRFVDEYKQVLARNNMFLGGWISDGYLWLDNATVLDSKDAAIALGLANNQEAIYDLNEGKEIRIKERPSDITSRQEPYREPEARAEGRRPSTKTQARAEAGAEAEARVEEIEGGVTGRPEITGVNAAAAASAASRSTDEGQRVAPIASTLSNYETEETLTERESYSVAKRLDWKPNTGSKGQRTGKAKPLRETIRDILARVGINASTYNVFNSDPRIVGFYKWNLTRSGIFKTTGRELWIKATELAHVGTAVHEVAHFLDQKYNISGKVKQLTGAGVKPPTTPTGIMAGLPATTQHIFRMIDYHFAQTGQLRSDAVSGLAEGWAESVRLYCESVDPSSVLPIQVKTFIDEMAFNNPEIYDILNATRSEYQAYLNAPAAEKVSFCLQDITRQVASPTESYFARQDRTSKWRGVLRLFEVKMQNRLHDLEVYEDQLKKAFMEHYQQAGEDPKAAWDQLLRDTGGLISQHLLGAQNKISYHTTQAVKFGISDPVDGQAIGPAGRAAFESFNGEAELNDFGRYMYAKVALLRKAQAAVEGKNYITGEASPLELQKLVNEIESGPNAQKFSQAMKDVTDYFNNLLDLEVKHDLITAGAADAMKTKHDIYMPFFRQMGDSKHRGSAGKILGAITSIKKLKGGTVMPVLDVYDAMVDRTNDVMSEVVRKSCEAKFLMQAEVSGVSGSWMRKLTADQAANAKDVTKITTAGTTYYYQIDPDLKTVLTQIGPQLSPLLADVLSVIGTPGAIARKFMVTWNVPYFTTKNYIRDLKTATIRGLQDTTGIKTSGDVGLTLEAAIKPLKALKGGPKSDVDLLFEQQGLAHMTQVKTSRSGTRRGLLARKFGDQEKRRTFLGTKGRTNYQTALDGIHWMAEKVEALNDVIELSPRREAFFRTLQALGQTQGAGFTVDSQGRINGKVPEWALSRASFNSMEVTTNFNRRGQWQPAIEPFFLFYNAAMQGMAGQLMTVQKVIKEPTGPQAKRFALSVAVGAVAKIAGLILMAMDRDDEGESSLQKWAEIPAYLHDYNDIWTFKGHAITVPREREWGGFYRAIDHAVAAMVMGGEGPSAWQHAKNFMSTEAAGRIPFTGGAAMTGVQLFFNYDLFRDEPVEKVWEKGRLPQYRYDDRTCGFAKLVAPLGGNPIFEFSPRQVDFIARNMVGQLFTKGTSFIDLLTGEGRLSSVPVVGPLMTEVIPRQSEADYRILRERSAMEFDEWENDRAVVPKEAVMRILDNEATFGVADSAIRIIKSSKEMDYETKQKVATGIARWALDRNPMDAYPNPLLEYDNPNIPPATKIQIMKLLGREIKGSINKRQKEKLGQEKLEATVRARTSLLKKLAPPKEE